MATLAPDNKLKMPSKFANNSGKKLDAIQSDD